MTKRPSDQQVAEALSRIRAAEGFTALLEDFALTEEQRMYVQTVIDALRATRALLGDEELPPARPAGDEPARILIVDDDAVQRLWAARSLERAGFEIESAATGRQALEVCAKQKWSLIVMDCEIPDVDGFEVTDQIRKDVGHLNRSTPIIAYSGYGITGYKERCMQVGMNSFLKKPASREELLSAVGRYAKAKERPA